MYERPIGYGAIHVWMRFKYGKAKRCEGKSCKGISKIFDWAMLREKSYDFKRENFIQLCRSCHSIYDCTDEKRRKMRVINMGHSVSKKTREKIGKQLKGRFIPEFQRKLARISSGKPVAKVQNGEIIQVFDNMIEAGKSVGRSISAISLAIRFGGMSGGYYWKLLGAKEAMDIKRKQIAHIEGAEYTKTYKKITKEALIQELKAN